MDFPSFVIAMKGGGGGVMTSLDEKNSIRLNKASREVSCP